jgi:hypothetical protein
LEIIIKVGENSMLITTPESGRKVEDKWEKWKIRKW